MHSFTHKTKKHTRTHTNIHRHTHAYMHTHARTYTDTHIHAYTRTRPEVASGKERQLSTAATIKRYLAGML